MIVFEGDSNNSDTWVPEAEGQMVTAPLLHASLVRSCHKVRDEDVDSEVAMVPFPLLFL